MDFETIDVTRTAVSGFTVRRITDADKKPPMTAAMTCFGSLWWGTKKPTLILSTKRFMEWIRDRIMKPDQVTPVNGGFLFNGAVWTYRDTIQPGWVFMLNEEYPNDPKFNGCYQQDDPENANAEG